MLALYLGVGWCRRRNVLASYLRVCRCRYERVSVVPSCRWMLVGVERNVLASYLRVGGC